MLRTRRTGDEGITLILTAVMMVVIVIMAGLAIDLGAVYNDRRQDQSAADSAALAGVQDLGSNGEIIEQVRMRMSSTLDVPASSLDLDGCSAGDLPPGFVGLSGANCVGLDNTGRRVAVRTPEAETTTAFARIMGRETITHSAFAVAGLEQDGFGNVLPWGIFGSEASNYGCLRAGTGAIPDELESFCRAQGNQGQNPPGNFGAVDLGAYTDPTLGCRGNLSASRLANNTATGVDHYLDLWTGGPVRPSTLQTGPGDCPNYAPLQPDGVQLIEGNAVKAAAASGLWRGGTFNDGSGPRLTRGTAGFLRQEQMDGVTVDGTPLWDFINESPAVLGAIPQSCHPDQFAGPDRRLGTADDLDAVPAAVRPYFEDNFLDPGLRVLALFDRCFTHFAGQPWTGFEGVPGLGPSEDPQCSVTCAQVPFFDTKAEPAGELYDLQLTPRFGYAPVLEGAGGHYFGIVRFQPVFIHGIYADCNSNRCNMTATPTLVEGTSKSAVDALTAMMIPPAALPPGLGMDRAPFEFGVNVFARLLR